MTLSVVLRHFIMHQTSNIQVVVNNYTTESYLLCSELYYMEINERHLTNKIASVVLDLFPGIPLKVDGT